MSVKKNFRYRTYRCLGMHNISGAGLFIPPPQYFQTQMKRRQTPRQ
jgi:hypothetical protein